MLKGSIKKFITDMFVYHGERVKSPEGRKGIRWSFSDMIAVAKLIISQILNTVVQQIFCHPIDLVLHNFHLFGC